MFKLHTNEEGIKVSARPILVLTCLKVGLELKLRSQSYHVGSIGYRFGDLQNRPIFKKNLTLTHRQKICMAPIMTNDSIFDASKYFQQNPSKS